MPPRGRSKNANGDAASPPHKKVVTIQVVEPPISDAAPSARLRVIFGRARHELELLKGHETRRATFREVAEALTKSAGKVGIMGNLVKATNAFLASVDPDSEESRKRRTQILIQNLVEQMNVLRDRKSGQKMVVPGTLSVNILSINHLRAGFKPIPYVAMRTARGEAQTSPVWRSQDPAKICFTGHNGSHRFQIPGDEACRFLHLDVMSKLDAADTVLGSTNLDITTLIPGTKHTLIQELTNGCAEDGELQFEIIFEPAKEPKSRAGDKLGDAAAEELVNDVRHSLARAKNICDDIAARLRKLEGISPTREPRGSTARRSTAANPRKTVRPEPIDTSSVFLRREPESRMTAAQSARTPKRVIKAESVWAIGGSSSSRNFDHRKSEPPAKSAAQQPTWTGEGGARPRASRSGTTGLLRSGTSDLQEGQPPPPLERTSVPEEDGVESDAADDAPGGGSPPPGAGGAGGADPRAASPSSPRLPRKRPGSDNMPQPPSESSSAAAAPPRRVPLPPPRRTPRSRDSRRSALPFIMRLNEWEVAPGALHGKTVGALDQANQAASAESGSASSDEEGASNPEALMQGAVSVPAPQGSTAAKGSRHSALPTLAKQDAAHEAAMFLDLGLGFKAGTPMRRARTTGAGAQAGGGGSRPGTAVPPWVADLATGAAAVAAAPWGAWPPMSRQRSVLMHKAPSSRLWSAGSGKDPTSGALHDQVMQEIAQEVQLGMEELRGLQDRMKLAPLPMLSEAVPAEIPRKPSAKLDTAEAVASDIEHAGWRILQRLGGTASPSLPSSVPTSKEECTLAGAPLAASRPPTAGLLLSTPRPLPSLMRRPGAALPPPGPPSRKLHLVGRGVSGWVYAPLATGYEGALLLPGQAEAGWPLPAPPGALWPGPPQVDSGG